MLAKILAFMRSIDPQQIKAFVELLTLLFANVPKNNLAQGGFGADSESAEFVGMCAQSGCDCDEANELVSKIKAA